MDDLFNAKGPFILHLIVYYSRSERVWTAHCLDFNLVEDGDSPEQAEKRLLQSVNSYIQEAKKRKMTASEVYARAPQPFWDMLIKSKPAKVRTSPRKSSMPYMTFRSPPVSLQDAV